MHINWGDLVAVYAAVVATGALGWQVYQWRLDRNAALEISIHLDKDRTFINGTIRNNNDYPVKILGVGVSIVQADRNPRSTRPTRTLMVQKVTLRVGFRSMGLDFHGTLPVKQMTAEEAGVPDVIQAHEGVRFRGEMPKLEPGYIVRVGVMSSLGRVYWGMAKQDEPSTWSMITGRHLR